MIPLQNKKYKVLYRQLQDSLYTSLYDSTQREWLLKWDALIAQYVWNEKASISAVCSIYINNPMFD